MRVRLTLASLVWLVVTACAMAGACTQLPSPGAQAPGTPQPDPPSPGPPVGRHLQQRNRCWRRSTAPRRRPGHPVGLADLRHVTVSFRGFDGRPHTGELVVHERVAAGVVAAFADLGWTWGGTWRSPRGFMHFSAPDG